MKVAIVTIESQNYGNRLQNYALQEILKDLGIDVFTLHRFPTKNSFADKIMLFLKALLKTKSYRFYHFNKQIKYGKEIVGKDSFPSNLSTQYDYFVAGSDQIWNPYYEYYGGECDFLEFADNKQKISYAASFGVSEIPNERKEEYQKFLSEFNKISVREKEGSDIVMELTGKEANIVLDPTLMINADKWRKCSKYEACIPDNPYCFVYSLGEKNDFFVDKLENIKQDLKIFDIGKTTKYGRNLPIGPSEFLYAIDNAEVVLTDSFHATVFSILFHKDVWVFERPGINMSSRITSLAKMFECDKNFDKHGTLHMCVNSDYKIFDKILEKERINSLKFLYDAFEMERRK